MSAAGWRSHVAGDAVSRIAVATAHLLDDPREGQGIPAWARSMASKCEIGEADFLFPTDKLVRDTGKHEHHMGARLPAFSRQLHTS